MRYLSRCHLIRLLRSRKGFTLLEMAIGLAAVGLMSSIALQNSSIGQSNDAYTQTRAQLADMQAGLDHFAKRNGYYPMPASTTPASINVQGTSVTSATASGITNVTADGVLIGNFPYTTVGYGRQLSDRPVQKRQRFRLPLYGVHAINHGREL